MQAGLEILHLGDMFRLLATVPIGRIGFIADDEVAVLPVRFLVDGQDVVFRTYVGTKLSNIEVGRYVCFEVDSYDAADADRVVGGGPRAGREGVRGGLRAARRTRPGVLGRDRRKASLDADQAHHDHRAADRVTRRRD